MTKQMDVPTRTPTPSGSRVWAAIFGGLVVACTFPLWGQAPKAAPPAVIEAQEFRLVSKTGDKTLARLFSGVYGGSPTLQLFGDDGVLRVEFIAQGTGGYAAFYDENKTKRLSLMVFPNAGGLWVSDSKGKDRVGVFSGDDGPVVFTADKDSNPLWLAPPLRVETKPGLVNPAGRPAAPNPAPSKGP